MRKNRLIFFICIVLVGFYYTNMAFANSESNTRNPNIVFANTASFTIKNTICCVNKIIGKPCIRSIVRFSPTVYKTNAVTLIFIITFSDDVIIDENDVFVSYISFSGGGYKIEDVYAGNNNSIWFVKVSVDSNTTYKLGDTVRIDSIAGYVFCDTNNITNEDYNVRHKFLAFHYLVVKYDKNHHSYNPAVGGPGIVRIIFDEPLDGAKCDVRNAQNSAPYEYDTIPDDYGIDRYCLHLTFDWCPLFPFYVYFHYLYREVWDEWGNKGELGSSGEIVVGEVTWGKQSFALVGNHINPFEVSNIHPNPIDDEVHFTVNVFEEGYLNIGLYDLAGSQLMDIATNKFMSANSSEKIHLTLGFLPSGSYTIMVSMGNNIIARQVIIVK